MILLRNSKKMFGIRSKLELLPLGLVQFNRDLFKSKENLLSFFNNDRLFLNYFSDQFNNLCHVGFE